MLSWLTLVAGRDSAVVRESPNRIAPRMGCFVLAGVILNGAWTQLNVIGWPVWILPAAAFILDGNRFRVGRWVFGQPTKPESAMTIVIGALVCAIHIVHVALTSREEFGFGGDEGYHLSATRAFAIYFMKAAPFLAGVLALWRLCRYFVPRFASSVAMMGLIAASYFLPDDPLFGRYPTGFYLLSTPLNVAFDIARIPFPFTPNHIVNALSVTAWLFVLRPLVLGRWPDWSVLPVALLIYFQGPSIVYVGGGLLEPWAFVFVLLGIEGAIVLDAERKWLAVLLAATATFFKETSILFLPPIWLLAMVDWQARRPVLRRHAIAAGVTAVIPFTTYYAARRGLHIVRGYEVAGASAVWTVARASEWIRNARYQLGPGGTIGVALLAAWSVCGFVFLRQGIWHHLVWGVSAIGLIVFFAADVASIPFTGYGRFLAYPLLALCGIVFMTAHWLAEHRRRFLIGVTLVLVALQSFTTTFVLALDFLPDYERNSLEWPQALVRFPIRSLAARVPDLAGDHQVSRIRVIVFEMDLISLRVAYPDLARRYDLQGEVQSPAAADCTCRSSGEAVIAGFQWPAHFAARASSRQRLEQEQSRCLTQLRATCASVALEQRPGGAVIGALGVGNR
jgi:hypothetical protein